MSRQEILQLNIKCRLCRKKLSPTQIYDMIRGKSYHYTCSRKCTNQIIYPLPDGVRRVKGHYKYTITCTVCGKVHDNASTKSQKTCSLKCAGKISSLRMKKSNPMMQNDVRDKVSKKLKEIKHKPYQQGGNGRGATIHQLELYNELVKYDDSFQLEYIIRTLKYRNELNTPTHYKIDVASSYHKIAIEIDGSSHNSKKVKECDQKKETVLGLLKWKVLRFSNHQIQEDTMNCVRKVLSTIYL